MVELGYVYNRHAANMRLKKSMAIGLIATDIRNPYFSELTMAIADSVYDSGYTLFTGYTRDSLERQQSQIEALIERQVDGIILLPAIGSIEEVIRAVTPSSTPLVQISRYFSDAFDYVGPDNRTASALLADHVRSLGPGTAVFIGGPSGSSARRERLEGLVEGFAGTSVVFDAENSVTTQNNSEDGGRGLAKVLDAGILPDIVIAYSDAVALGVYAELRRRDLEPGRDAAIASFDDISYAAFLVPQLTTVATYPARVGLEAARLLLDRISDPDRVPQRVLIDPALKPRASTALWRPRR